MTMPAPAVLRFGLAVGLALGLPTVRPAPLAAQPATEMFLLLRGTDTIAVERMRRTPTRLEGELVFRPQRMRWSYVATVTPSGLVTRIQTAIRRADAAPDADPLQRASLVFVDDSVLVSLHDGPPSQRLGTEVGAMPYINPSFALFELMADRALRPGVDSAAVPMFLVSGGQTVPAQFRRAGADSIVGFVSAESRLGWRDGRITGGTVPAQGLVLLRTAADDEALHVPRPDYSAPAGAPYTADAVTVPTPMGHTLAGTLTLPRTRTGRVPAVITVTGSGAQDRDEEIPTVRGYRPFRQIADSLGHVGIAVLRMDDRGFGESGGDATTATSRDLARDIAAGIAWLRQRPEIDPARIAVVGHSEGGLIAPMLAADDTTLRAIVIMAGPSRTGREIIAYQQRYAIEHAPTIRPEARDSALAAARTTLDSLSRAQPWLGFFLDYDPAPTARRVRVPTLILHGATDRQVTVDQAAELESLIRAGGNPRVTTLVFPEANHLFVQDPDGSPSGYSRLPTGHIRDDVMKVLVGWLVEELRPNSGGAR